MKILLLNTYPSGGGAAVACQRTMALLSQAGMEVRMLTFTEFGWRDLFLPKIYRGMWKLSAYG